MKKPFAISVGLFLFLFGLAFAKATQGPKEHHQIPKQAGLTKEE